MTDLLFSTTKACLIAGFYPILIGLISQARKQLMWVCFFLFVGLAIVFQSRAAIGGIALSTALLQEIKFNGKGLIFMLLFAVVLVLINMDSCFGRLFIWYNIVSHISEIPLLGKGSYLFQSTYANWQAGYFATHTDYTKAYYVADSPMFAYNEWLQLYVEWGIIAVLLLTGAAILNIKLMKKVARVYKGFVVSNFTILAFCLVCFPLHQDYTIAFFIFNHLVLLTLMLKNHWWGTRIVFSLIALLTFSFLYFEWNKNRQVDKWMASYQVPLIERRKILDTSFPDLCHDPFFLENYVSVLLKEKDFVVASNVLQRYKNFMNQYQYHMINGNRLALLAYQDSAIINYQQAKSIIPNRFEPRYKIMILQLMKNNWPNAQLIASEIEKMPVKISSLRVSLIKKDAALVLNGKTPMMFN